MKFLSVLAISAAALLGSVQAQGTGTAVTSAAVPTSTAEAPFIRCLEACDPSDNDCRAHCIAVPSPNETQVNATIACVAGCDQGNGTAADIQAYTECRDNCIGMHFYTTDGTPTATGSSGSSPSGTGASANPTDTSAGESGSSGSATSTSSNGNATGTPGAAPAVVVGSSLGLFALLAAVFAL